MNDRSATVGRIARNASSHMHRALLGLGLLLAASSATAVPDPSPPNVLKLTLFAQGVQIYRSMETSPGVFTWAFFGPEATLFTDDSTGTRVGFHFNVNTAPLDTLTVCNVSGFACPSWQADADGSAVTVARPIDMNPSPNPDSITELLLPATTHVAPGLLANIAFVQRLDTVGGLATFCAAATASGQQCSSPYTATYTFFAPVPLPAGVVLFASGAAGLLGTVRRRRGEQGANWR